MSARYTSNGKRKSSMTHASRGHECAFCGRVCFGNGGQVSHGRWHVNRDQAIELVKHYGSYPPMSSRLFVAVDDQELITRLLGEGFEQVLST